MKISYKKLWILLAEREMSKQEFRELCILLLGQLQSLTKVRKFLLIFAMSFVQNKK